MFSVMFTMRAIGTVSVSRIHLSSAFMAGLAYYPEEHQSLQHGTNAKYHRICSPLVFDSQEVRKNVV